MSNPYLTDLINDLIVKAANHFYGENDYKLVIKPLSSPDKYINPFEMKPWDRHSALTLSVSNGITFGSVGISNEAYEMLEKKDPNPDLIASLLLALRPGAFASYMDVAKWVEDALKKKGQDDE